MGFFLLEASLTQPLNKLLGSMLPHREGLKALTQRLSKSKFNQISSQVESQFKPTSALVQLLTHLFDLKKTNDGLVDDGELDQLLVQTYSLLFLEFIDSTQVTEETNLEFAGVLRRCLACCRQMPWGTPE